VVCAYKQEKRKKKKKKKKKTACIKSLPHIGVATGISGETPIILGTAVLLSDRSSWTTTLLIKVGAEGRVDDDLR